MRRRNTRAFAPPLDLRFIDLFMAIILALSFIAIMLTVVARMIPTEVTPPPATRKESVAELKKQLDAALTAQHQAEAQLKALQGQASEHVSFGLPWWLIGLCALLGVFALFLSWRVRLRLGSDLPKLWTWLAGTAVVAALTWWTRSNSDTKGNLRLADITWWGIDALCLGLLLVAYVLVNSIRESRTALGEFKSRPRPPRSGEGVPRPPRSGDGAPRSSQSGAPRSGDAVAGQPRAAHRDMS